MDRQRFQRTAIRPGRPPPRHPRNRREHRATHNRRTSDRREAHRTHDSSSLEDAKTRSSRLLARSAHRSSRKEPLVPDCLLKRSRRELLLVPVGILPAAGAGRGLRERPEPVRVRRRRGSLDSPQGDGARDAATRLTRQQECPGTDRFAFAAEGQNQVGKPSICENPSVGNGLPVAADGLPPPCRGSNRRPAFPKAGRRHLTNGAGRGVRRARAASGRTSSPPAIRPALAAPSNLTPRSSVI
jgi:hypothetical protein